MLKKIFNVTNHQKILSFLVDNIREEYYDRQVSRLTGVSRAGTNFALRDLVKAGLSRRKKQGRMYFYSVDAQDVVIKQFKVLQNLILIYPLINKLKPLCLKLIFYGSRSKGENLKESDFDILIIANRKEEVENIILKSSLREKLKPIIMTPNELVKLRKKNPVFYEEMFKGIILWEQKQT